MSRLRAVGGWTLERRRVLALAAAAVIFVLLAYKLFLADEEIAPPQVRVAFATSVIGTGEGAVGVTPDGEVLTGSPPPEEGTLPSLPDVAPPTGGRLAGPMLAQAKVLGAAPAPLRACLARSLVGESGVGVELRSGIEVRFGDASRAAEKWAAAIALLADPTITALDYVNVVAPHRPTTYGSSHPLPAPGEGEDGACGA